MSGVLKFEKGAFFENYFTLLQKAVDSHINGLSYKSFEDFFNKLLEYLSLDWLDFHEEFGNDIREVKATRNLLLHNDLIVNEQYIETAGVKRRESEPRRKLSVDKTYLQGAIKVLVRFEETLRERLFEKYKGYTKVNANKRLWSFLFKSPLMPYDGFWKFDEKMDQIDAFKRGQYEASLSNSETLMLSLWRAHFCGRGGESMERFDMRHFDSSHQEKVLFFLSVAGDFDFE